MTCSDDHDAADVTGPEMEVMDSTLHRDAGIAANSRCWELLNAHQRDEDASDELLTAAFTSRYHWRIAGGPQQYVLADWMVSRAAAALGYGELAVHFAVRAQAQTTEDLPVWLHASVAEGLARAYAAAGDAEQRSQWIERATLLVAQIPSWDERFLVNCQLETVPTP